MQLAAHGSLQLSGLWHSQRSAQGGVPYLTRRQIETAPSAALRRSVLMYCDKLDAYSLGIQGVGTWCCRITAR